MKPLLTILIAFATSVTLVAAPIDKTAEELDIREATFRYQFGKNTSLQQRHVDAYYLSTPDKDGKETDPPKAFIDRFARNKPPVKSVSECTASSNKGVVNSKTGRLGLIFNTGAIKWISDAEVEVSGGYYEGGKSASGNTYHLKKVDGKWKVIKDAMDWIA